MATKMTREEAIKKVRQMSLPKETMEIIEALAPELAESEDERMMREFNDWLCEGIECLTNDLRDEEDRRTLNMLCYILTKVKDRLKKQKEQKLIMANSPQLKEQKKEKFPPYVTGFKGDPDPAGVWKPSKEQMKALYYACCIAFKEERCFHPSLSRLYHDLRKLIRR